QVAMDDAALVDEVHGTRQSLQQFRGLGEWWRAAQQALRETASVGKLHGKVRHLLPFAEVVYLDDVRMGQGDYGLGLHLEARPFLRPGVDSTADHLERYRTLRSELPGPVYDSHTTGCELIEDLVSRNGRPIPDRSL